MKKLAGFPAAREDRHASVGLHDEAALRVVAFTLKPGQAIPLHTSPSTVWAHVVRGSGRFHGADAAVELSAGESVVYDPDEPHAIDALTDVLEFIVVIAPGPTAAVEPVTGPRTVG